MLNVVILIGIIRNVVEHGVLCECHSDVRHMLIDISLTVTVMCVMLFGWLLLFSVAF
jgi:hypothetical protein